ncbi:hypothetical protein HZA99_03815 [Candidatus Woesearchaeota archaeon]|nr:hypothetical protein [Candidatus Woesearchaeota archaeon]
MAKTIQEQAQKFNITSIMITAIVTALAFVVGLFWNDATKTTIESLFPNSDAIGMKLVVAIFVTVGVTIAIYIIYRTQKITEKYEKKLKQIALEQKRKLDLKRKKYQQYVLGSKI